MFSFFFNTEISNENVLDQFYVCVGIEDGMMSHDAYTLTHT